MIELKILKVGILNIANRNILNIERKYSASTPGFLHNSLNINNMSVANLTAVSSLLNSSILRLITT